MALMVLVRLPAGKELNIEVESFYEAFIANSIAPFIAKVKVKEDNYIDLDGWSIGPADWFKIVEE